MKAPRLALLAVALLAALAGCEAPPDEAWLRVAAVEDSAGKPVTSLAVWLRDGAAAETVALQLENRSSTLGVKNGGTGILVRRLRVEASGGGVALPVQEVPATLYLPPSAEAGTALAVAVVTPALKRWVRDNLVIPPGGLDGAARVTVHALTDEGRELTTAAGFALQFLDRSKP